MTKILLLFVLLIVVSGCVKIQIGSTAEEEEPPTEPEQEGQLPAKTQIKVSGQGVEMIISPSTDNTVKDEIIITATKVPQDTGVIGFAIIGPGIEAIEKTGPNLGYDDDGSDGWSLEFDTNSYPNNEYSLGIIAFPANRKSGEPPLGAAQARMVIENSEFSPVPSPITTAPYKVI